MKCPDPETVIDQICEHVRAKLREFRSDGGRYDRTVHVIIPESDLVKVTALADSPENWGKGTPKEPGYYWAKLTSGAVVPVSLGWNRGANVAAELTLEAHTFWSNGDPVLVAKWGPRIVKPGDPPDGWTSEVFEATRPKDRNNGKVREAR